MTDTSDRHDQAREPAVLLAPARPVSYGDAWTLQQYLHAERLIDRQPDTLLLLQHEPVYTLGRRTALSHLPRGVAALRATGAAVEAVNRGGSVTYHGPGQLVGYPILKLTRYASGPKEYVRLLEEVLRWTLLSWGIEGYRIDGRPGLFVRQGLQASKIAAIGVRVDRGITLHGFALNVDLDLAPFSVIVPCGLAACRTTSIAAVRRSSAPIGLVRRDVERWFANVFSLTWDSRPMRPALASIENLLTSEQVADA